MMMVVSRHEMGQKILNPTLLGNLIEDSKIETVLRSNGTTSNGRSWDVIESDEYGKECNGKGREPKQGCCFDSHG
jgi:hypothetical protein